MHTVNAPNERTWSIVLMNVIYAHSIPYNSSDKIVYILMYYIILSWNTVTSLMRILISEWYWDISNHMTIKFTENI